MERKNDLLMELRNSILIKLCKYCASDYDHRGMELDIEISFRNEIITSAFFDISVGILELGSMGTSEYPPTPDIVEFRLNKAYIKSLIGTRGKELSNLKKALNSLLADCEGKILND